LERPDELGRDGIFQRTHLLLQPQYHFIGLIRWRLCADQDQTAHPARVTQRHSLCEEGPRRSTDKGSFFDSDRFHERIDIGSEVLGRVAALWLIRVPVSALGEREGVILW
jgi:hypothetical protein